jgi:hypothetical protein
LPVAALAIAILMTGGDARADYQPGSKNKGGGERGRSNSGTKGPTVNGPKSGTENPAAKPATENLKTVMPNGAKTVTGNTGKPGNKGPGKTNWNKTTKDGWNKTGWNSFYNSQHQLHHHGYWNSGLWIMPLAIAGGQPWYYMQPTFTIAQGQKWLGVTYEPYDGRGAYVTGVYENSAGALAGLEVGDVIVSLNGADATNLPAAVQAAPNVVEMLVLSGRSGELVQTRVNLLR